MNTKERLIEELNIDGYYFVDTYECKNRFWNLIQFIYPLGIRWQKNISLVSYMPLGYIRNIYINSVTGLCSIYKEEGANAKDITQLFNNYLEEIQPHVWMHSVLAAKQLELKIEYYNNHFKKWQVLEHSYLNTEFKHRINYKEPVQEKQEKQEKLVPNEIWDILDNSILTISRRIVAIAKDKDGKIKAYSTVPDCNEGEGKWFKWGCSSYKLNMEKYFKNAKIHDVDWKDSLCIRPNLESTK